MRAKLLAALAILALSAAQASAQNLLENPGFETPLTDPPTSVGDWFPFGSGGNGTAIQSSTMPHGGQMHMELELVGAMQFAGVFQDLPGPVAPGQTVTFTGWAKNASGAPFAATQEIKIEWQGAPQNRVDVLSLGSDYEQFTHTGVAPPGTTGARVTYALSSFGAGQGDALVYLDDLSAVVVPEPTALALMGLGLLGLLRRCK